jgi:hypothetical protein
MLPGLVAVLESVDSSRCIQPASFCADGSVNSPPSNRTHDPTNRLISNHGNHYPLVQIGRIDGQTLVVGGFCQCRAQDWDSSIWSDREGWWCPPVRFSRIDGHTFLLRGLYQGESQLSDYSIWSYCQDWWCPPTASERRGDTFKRFILVYVVYLVVYDSG